jgi:hypothetical protein
LNCSHPGNGAPSNVETITEVELLVEMFFICSGSGKLKVEPDFAKLSGMVTTKTPVPFVPVKIGVVPPEDDPPVSDETPNVVPLLFVEFPPGITPLPPTVDVPPLLELMSEVGAFVVLLVVVGGVGN